MRRKPAILLFILILLLLAGGGVAFYLHLRKQGRPEFSEVDQFLRQVPDSSEWRMTGSREKVWMVQNAKPTWMEYLGRSRDKKLIDQSFTFERTHQGQVVSAYVSVKHEDARIEMVIIQVQAGNQELRKMLLEKFPALRGLVYQHPRGIL